MDENEELRLLYLEWSKEVKKWHTKQINDDLGMPVLSCHPNEYWDSESFREKMYSIHTVFHDGEVQNIAEICREGIVVNTDHDVLMVAAAIHNQFENNGDYSPEEIIKCAKLIFHELGFDGLVSKLQIIQATHKIAKLDARSQQLKKKRQKAVLSESQKKYLREYNSCSSHTPKASHNELVKIVNQQLNLNRDPKTVKIWLSKSKD